MIELRHLHKTFGNLKAVEDISLQIRDGETLVLLGTSGSGKTTTLRMINRLVEPDSGSIFIDGENILDQSRELLRRKMGYVLQGYGLFPHYTVSENIAIVPGLLKWPKEKIHERVDELMHKLQLDPAQYRDAYPAELSGGQKQRVGLARALAADPPILLMDEPFGALDPLTRASVRDEFKSLDELNKKTIILVTHDVQEAFELGDRIALMHQGSIIQLGKPVDLLLRPQSDFAKNFFSGKKLELEWRSVLLSDIWEKLPDVHTVTETILNSRQNLWEAMDGLAEASGNIYARHDGDGTTKMISFENLRLALQHLKRSTDG